MHDIAVVIQVSKQPLEYRRLSAVSRFGSRSLIGQSPTGPVPDSAAMTHIYLETQDKTLIGKIADHAADPVRCRIADHLVGTDTARQRLSIARRTRPVVDQQRALQIGKDGVGRRRTIKHPKR